MAYLDPHQTFQSALHQPAAAIAGLNFGRQEWEVIALARKDGLGSLRDPSWLGRTIERLFGLGGSRRLANPRLEALRRFAVLAWHHGYTLPVSALKAFKAEGYSMDQIEFLLARISSERLAARRGGRA